MAMNDSPSDAPRTSVAKKPYEKPTFRYEEVFVTSALTCGKIAGLSQTCNQQPKVS